jgi:hypothetical protein
VRGTPGFRIAALAALLALGGCSLNPFKSSAPKEACPSAIVLQPLANTAIFAPGTAEPRPERVAFYGLLSEVDARCDYTPGGVHVRLDVVLIGQRGPASQGNDIQLNYFVAVVAPGERIVSKKPFAVHVAFNGNAIRAGVTDHIEETIPANAGRGSDLEVAVGFQETPQDIDFYKHFRGR